MPRINAKKPTFDTPAAAALERLSKSALIDVVLDLVALQNEMEPGEVDAGLIAEAANPRLAARGDKPL
jgi:hypothetical protein